MPKKTFEEVEPIIDSILEKNRSKWKLGAVKYFDYDDLKQEIKVHIYDKFDMWDQRRDFDPWCSTVIRNQIQNKKRNLWRNHEKPCADCYFNKGMGMCAFTSSGNQCGECEEYAHWESKKKNAYEMKMAVSVEKEDGEIPYNASTEVDIDQFLFRLNEILQQDLKDGAIDKATYKIFYLTWISKLPDDVIAKKMDYKSNEKNRAAGYRSLATHRKIVHNRAKELLGEEDYNFL
jgi:DNA-directed RNA polymerase specialized sigma24 family protein